ncbi:PQQ-dependent sugar dehydrogenase [Calidithermus timidus]|jgi:glucose/arabinose dehydrogenase|uniref:PQQ-dependent sugar dehydrogenase n=1 Tax=Calidithermus timidus TaxID=307124 RepID=UPI000376CC6A|nr:PQQ-dependent sugar dehydrogenase [Calidithermus timidus]
MNRMVALGLLLLAAGCKTDQGEPPAAKYKIELVKDVKAGVIWSLNFGPDGRLYFTDRDRSRVELSALDLASGNITTYASSAAVRDEGEGGVLGLELDANFATNKKVYICYSYWKDGDSSVEANARNRVSSFVISGSSLTGELKLFDDMLGWWNHNGCRVLLSPDKQYLFITMGDAAAAPSNVPGEPDDSQKAQSKKLLAGKIFRIKLDGSIPTDNPFYNDPEVSGQAKAMWTLSHRNPQGLAFDPATGKLWSTEHGPDKKDELNLIKPGYNYGWPDCMGTDPCPAHPPYQPAAKEYYSDRTIAISDLTFYRADAFPAWKGSLFFVTLKTGRMYRLELSGESIAEEELIVGNLNDQAGSYGRLRDVTVGPDGFIYSSTDESKIYRIVPDAQ